MNEQEAVELLPWYVNGTLDAHEAREVEAFLARSPEYAEELEDLRALKRVVETVGADEPAWKPTLVHDALHRIDAYERERRETDEASLPARLRRAWQALRGGWEATPGMGRLALAVQLGLILALGATLLRAPGEPGVATLSGSSATHGPRGGALVSVGFQPTASEADLRALLGELDARIVAGPSAQRLWTVELGVGPEETQGVAAGIERLRARRDVVRYAEPRVP